MTPAHRLSPDVNVNSKPEIAPGQSLGYRTPLPVSGQASQGKTFSPYIQQPQSQLSPSTNVDKRAASPRQSPSDISTPPTKRRNRAEIDSTHIPLSSATAALIREQSKKDTSLWLQYSTPLSKSVESAATSVSKLQLSGNKTPNTSNLYTNPNPSKIARTGTHTSMRSGPRQYTRNIVGGLSTSPRIKSMWADSSMSSAIVASEGQYTTATTSAELLSSIKRAPKLNERSFCPHMEVVKIPPTPELPEPISTSSAKAPESRFQKEIGRNKEEVINKPDVITKKPRDETSTSCPIIPPSEQAQKGHAVTQKEIYTQIMSENQTENHNSKVDSSKTTQSCTQELKIQNVATEPAKKRQPASLSCTSVTNSKLSSLPTSTNPPGSLGLLFTPFDPAASTSTTTSFPSSVKTASTPAFANQPPEIISKKLPERETVSLPQLESHASRVEPSPPPQCPKPHNALATEPKPTIQLANEFMQPQKVPANEKTTTKVTSFLPDSTLSNASTLVSNTAVDSLAVPTETRPFSPPIIKQKPESEKPKSTSTETTSKSPPANSVSTLFEQKTVPPPASVFGSPSTIFGPLPSTQPITRGDSPATTVTDSSKASVIHAPSPVLTQPSQVPIDLPSSKGSESKKSDDKTGDNVSSPPPLFGLPSTTGNPTKSIFSPAPTVPCIFGKPDSASPTLPESKTEKPAPPPPSTFGFTPSTGFSPFSSLGSTTTSPLFGGSSVTSTAFTTPSLSPTFGTSTTTATTPAAPLFGSTMPVFGTTGFSSDAPSAPKFGSTTDSAAPFVFGNKGQNKAKSTGTRRPKKT
ncbi:hypothetical protein Pelo_13079 [Pelomyxa schiedti]|nr:hypothetical protein Pelo_13079 [Pelomyxa schiedti]